MATLILVNGMPATGKSTFSQWLSKELEIPLISKDGLKEYIFNTMGTADRDYSMMVGRASAKFLYIIADEFVSSNKSLIIENAFFHEFAKPEFEKLLDKYSCNFIELYLYTSEQERLRRFKEREDSGNRHKGHVDGLNYKNMVDNPAINDRYDSLNIGETIRIDTTDFSNIKYDDVLNKIRVITTKGGIDEITN